MYAEFGADLLFKEGLIRKFAEGYCEECELARSGNEEAEQEAEEDNVLTVIGNSYLLTTAFVNLVENNCKYSSNRTSSVLIAYWEQWAIIRLSDNGVGMSDADKENLFKLFYRGENKNIAPGNGIGMVLTQKIIHLHKGELTVSSHKDEGTTFVVKLPHI